MELVVIAVALLALVAAVVWHAVDTLWARRLVVRREVLVQLLSGNAVRGVLWASKARRLVIKSATLFEPGADPKAMDGDVVVERGNVDYVQVLG
jgi:hypothetical protein